MSRRADSMVSFSPVVAIASLVLAACFSYLVIDVFDRDGSRNVDSSSYDGDESVNHMDAAYRNIAVTPREDYGNGEAGVAQEDDRYEYAVSPKAATGGFATPPSVNSSGRNVTSADRRAAWPAFVDETTQAPPVTNSSSIVESLFPSAARKSANVDAQAESVIETNTANSANTTQVGAQPNTGGEVSPFDRSPASLEQQQELMAEVAVDLDETQKIRCYPIDNQGGPPCMCELTIIKQGQTQSELIDNCN